MSTLSFGINKTVIHLTKNSVISLSLTHKKKKTNKTSKKFPKYYKNQCTLLILNDKPKVPSNSSAVPVTQP